MPRKIWGDLPTIFVLHYLCDKSRRNKGHTYIIIKRMTKQQDNRQLRRSVACEKDKNHKKGFFAFILPQFLWASILRMN